jgi:predicted lipoprotein
MNARVFAIPLFWSLLTGCKPWVVRPIGAQDDGPRSAAAFVASIWPARVLSHPKLARGEGRILRFDDSSRSAVLLVDTPPFDGRADIAIQMGPVLRGTALRDTLDFIRFDDFLNQLEFARVANELNQRIWSDVLAQFPRAGLVGRSISYAGAIERPAESGPPLLTPVQLKVAGK